MRACNLETVDIFCDGLPNGACPNRFGIEYVKGIPLCAVHRPSDALVVALLESVGSPMTGAAFRPVGSGGENRG